MATAGGCLCFNKHKSYLNFLLNFESKFYHCKNNVLSRVNNNPDRDLVNDFHIQNLASQECYEEKHLKVNKKMKSVVQLSAVEALRVDWHGYVV